MDYLIYFQQYPLLKGLAVLILFIIASKIFLYISKKIVRRAVAKTETELDDKLIDITETPIAVILLILGIKLALVVSGVEFNLLDYLDKILNSLIIIAIGYAVAAIIDMIIEMWGQKFSKKSKIKVSGDLLSLMHKTVKVVVLVVTFLIVLKEWGVNIGPLLASLGIAGLAIGLALQNTLSNIFGGVSLIFDRAFKVGDIVEVGTVKGTVYEIGLRSTRVKTFNNELVVIPNGQLANENIINYNKPNMKARIVIPFTVAYGTKHEKVKSLVLGVVKKLNHVLTDPAPFVRFENMGDSALEFKVYFWVDSLKEKYGVKDKAIGLIYDNLNKSRIGIPYPQMDVHLKK